MAEIALAASATKPSQNSRVEVLPVRGLLLAEGYPCRELAIPLTREQVR